MNPQDDCPVRGNTGERPVDRYATELDFLRPAAAVPAFDTHELIIRQVHADSHVRFNNLAYSAPPVTNGKRIIAESAHVRTVASSPRSPFEILLSGQVPVSHLVPAVGRRRVTLSARERDQAGRSGRRAAKETPEFVRGAFPRGSLVIPSR